MLQSAMISVALQHGRASDLIAERHIDVHLLSLSIMEA